MGAVSMRPSTAAVKKGVSGIERHKVIHGAAVVGNRSSFF